MPDRPLVCICIPCYNNAATIEKTLKSIVEQDYPNLKIKVFDNASTDRSRDIVKSFMGKNRAIELFTRETTVSGEDNFNTCIANAEGEFSAIFHSDDVYHLDIVSKQVGFLLKRANCQAVATHARIIDENDNVTGERFVPPEIINQDSIELQRLQLIELSFKYGNFITCPSVLFRTEVLKDHIQSFQGHLFKSSSDLNVWFRVSEKGSFGFLNQALIDYRESTASFSFNLARVRVEDHDLFLVLNELLENNEFSSDQQQLLQQLKEFLIMKDRANTNLNRMILNKRPYQHVALLKNLQWVFGSGFHFKFFIIALITKILTVLPFQKSIGKLVQKVKFSNG